MANSFATVGSDDNCLPASDVNFDRPLTISVAVGITAASRLRGGIAHTGGISISLGSVLKVRNVVRIAATPSIMQ